MLIDTHCHINILVKNTFDTPLDKQQVKDVNFIAQEAIKNGVAIIINVGTSIIESNNCILLAQKYPNMYAVIGIHPNDCTDTWKRDVAELKKLALQKEELKIVGIGETGLDRHYPGYNIDRQTDVFKAQIELALEYELPLVIHTRDAHDEVLKVLDEYRKDGVRGVIHCFSEGLSFALHAIDLNFVLGIGGPLTYPKNTILREVFTALSLDHIILETDAPFLPPQAMRGKQNQPKYIKDIAEFLANLRGISYEAVAEQTTLNAKKLFKLP